MKKFIAFSIAAFVLSILFVSCEKHRLDKEAVPEAFTLYFTNPTAGQLFTAGDSVSITGMAIYKENIHGYDIRIRAANDTTVRYFTHVHEHNDTLLINHKWKSTVADKGNMEAEVVLYLDHDGHTGSKKAAFVVQ